ncbi:uncharacterized protein FA14DRAFT_188659 [Meira miltonrushii]|uniref:cDENN domain-containing protein n=1 Tax=Meira miltonrushii TaxID=1280837 RepID=A0A316VBT3_9BASI|nr:uncharacterized protein FA14DRAFT_188659 [Meira miltonrushii]PWN34578.1 hypothetical protein FA14DRAFT_188659 [Meira miltonrushii]
MDIGDLVNFTNPCLQYEEMLGEGILYLGLPDRLQEHGWKYCSSMKNRTSNHPTFKPILQSAIIRYKGTIMQFQEIDLEDMESELENLIEKCRKQCLPFDCSIVEDRTITSSRQISYHSFPIKHDHALTRQPSKSIQQEQRGRADETLYAHVLTIRTALTSARKQELKQYQKATQSSKQRREADVTWLKLTAPRAICFLSKYPLHFLFADILRFAYLRYGGKSRMIDFLNHCFLTPVTSLDRQIQIKISSLEDDVHFTHVSTCTINDNVSIPDPIPAILTAAINKEQCLDAILLDKRVALVSDSVTLLSFCARELESLLGSQIVYPIVHHTELHSIIAKEQGKYIIPVQRQMSHVLSMTEIHIIDLDRGVSKHKGSSKLSKWLPTRSKLSDRHRSTSVWLDRDLFGFKNSTFRNVGTIEVGKPVSFGGAPSGDLALEALDVPNRGWTIQEVVGEMQSITNKPPTRPLTKRKSMLFGRKNKVTSSAAKDLSSPKLQEPAAERIEITPQLPKLENYQIGPITNEFVGERSHDSVTAVDQPYESFLGLKEGKRWQDLRIRAVQSYSNIDVIKQRKRNRKIGRILEDGVKEFSSYEDDDLPNALSIDAQKHFPTEDAKGRTESLQTPRSQATGFTSTTETMPLTPTTAQIPRAPYQSKKEEEEPIPSSSPPERPRTPIVTSSHFDWLEDVESMQVQLEQMIERLENENAEQINSVEQNHEEYARIWQAFCLTPPTNRSEEVKNSTSNEFQQIVEWRNDVQGGYFDEEPMTSFFDDDLFNSSWNTRWERRNSV